MTRTLAYTYRTIRSARTTVDQLRYIHPKVTGFAKRTGVTVAQAKDWLRGKYPAVDQKDLGYVPCLSEANMYNDGEATFELSHPLPEHRYGLARQHDNCTRVHYNSATWAVIQEKCFNTGPKLLKDYPEERVLVCDAWHNANPRARLNFLEWCQSFYSVTDETSTGEVHFIDDSVTVYSPDTCRYTIKTDQALVHLRNIKNMSIARCRALIGEEL